MKTHEEILQSLGELSPSDRMWIIDRLSPTARGTLLNGVAYGTRESSAQAPLVMETKSVTKTSESDRIRAALNVADVRQVAASLTSEPAWVVHAALSRDRTWSPDLLGLLPSSLRSEVDNLERSHCRYSDSLVEAVERSLAAALELNPLAPSSRWGTLFGGISAQLTRSRMRLRL